MIGGRLRAAGNGEAAAQDEPDGHMLPEGWESQTDEQNRRFYVNNAERITQWEFPTP